MEIGLSSESKIYYLRHHRLILLKIITLFSHFNHLALKITFYCKLRCKYQTLFSKAFKSVEGSLSKSRVI